MRGSASEDLIVKKNKRLLLLFTVGPNHPSNGSFKRVFLHNFVTLKLLLTKLGKWVWDIVPIVLTALMTCLMSNYDVIIDGVISYFSFQFSNVETLNTANRLYIVLKLAGIWLFKVRNKFESKLISPPYEIFPRKRVLLVPPFSVMLQIGFTKWQEQIK